MTQSSYKKKGFIWGHGSRGLESMIGAKHSGRKLFDHIIIHTGGRGRREEGGGRLSYKPSKLIYSDVLPTAKALPPKSSITSPNCTTEWESSVQMHEPIEDTSHLKYQISLQSLSPNFEDLELWHC
jgi:hypothetical protein